MQSGMAELPLLEKEDEEASARLAHSDVAIEAAARFGTRRGEVLKERVLRGGQRR